MKLMKWIPKGLRRRIERGRRIVEITKRYELHPAELPLLIRLHSVGADGSILYPSDGPREPEGLALDHLLSLGMIRRVFDPRLNLDQRMAMDRLWGFQLTDHGRRVAEWVIEVVR